MHSSRFSCSEEPWKPENPWTWRSHIGVAPRGSPSGACAARARIAPRTCELEFRTSVRADKAPETRDADTYRAFSRHVVRQPAGRARTIGKPGAVAGTLTEWTTPSLSLKGAPRSQRGPMAVRPVSERKRAPMGRPERRPRLRATQ